MFNTDKCKLITVLSLLSLYFSREGKPYCEKDYQAEFGVTCAGCNGYITGKVLQVCINLRGIVVDKAFDFSSMLNKRFWWKHEYIRILSEDIHHQDPSFCLPW